MDMSFWTKLSPTVKNIKVKKLFFGQYLFKIKCYCPGARTIYSKNYDCLRKSIYQRLEMHEKSYNYGGSWYQLYSKIKTDEFAFNVRLNQLQYFQMLQDFDNFSIRIEEPFISIYSNKEEDLYQIAKNCYPDRLREIHLPESIAAQHVLLNNEIIVSQQSDFDYKVLLKPYKFDNQQTKEFFKNTLSNISVSVKLTKSTKNFISSPAMYYTGGHLYADNLHTVLLLQLAFPNLISSIFRVRCLH